MPIYSVNGTWKNFVSELATCVAHHRPIVSSGEYSVENEGKIYLKFDNPGVFVQENLWGYRLTAEKLTILPSVCNEGCSYTYRRIQ